MSFKEISPKEIPSNLFHEIADKWFLITAVNKDGRVNTMTASWGCMGVLWNKNVAVCFIRPTRYTLEFVNEAESFTLTFLKDGYKNALTLCGTKSGRDTDKIKDSGLHVNIENGLAFFDEARLTFVCKKLYVGEIREENFLCKDICDKNYPIKDFHKIFVCDIEKVLEHN